MKKEQSVPKRRHIKYIRRGITQKKGYNKYALVITSHQTIAVEVQSAPFNITQKTALNASLIFV
jgi:hypothetical protein